MPTQSQPLAILDSQGRVVTFVRPDVPAGWAPPPGCTAVTADALPPGWVRAPDASPVPESISARQARLWLIRNGVTLAAVDQAIASVPDALAREGVRIEWEYATEIRRDSPMLATLAGALGLNATKLDTAFRQAATI